MSTVMYDEMGQLVELLDAKPAPQESVRREMVRARLHPETPAEIRERTKDIKRSWLVKRLIASDAYGVFAAESKAGKTWAAMDLGLAVANGGKWFGKFDCEQGGVIYFCGEGTSQNTLRRHDAICDFYGYNNDCDIHYVHRVPFMGDADHLAVVAEMLASFKPALVVLDPAYLSARGANQADIFAMGEMLESLQELAINAGCALAVIHHWNKTGTGAGKSRMSGAGWDAWGRFLVSMELRKDEHEDDTGKSRALLRCQATGGEVSVEPWQVEREIWADDQDDINSAMHYTVSAPASPSRSFRPTGIMERLSKWLEQMGEDVSWRTARTAPVGKGGKTAGRETLDLSLTILRDEGYIDWPKGKAIKHLKPYRQSEDPQSDEYKGEGSAAPYGGRESDNQWF